ncbi:MAG: hypothetical protein GX790_04285 [Syntrophomonadaceae bacterium]|nr:hypothetical protein [Syntrophomonadaceae bacterium]
MNIVYSTGPVENAAGNASVSTWVKVLNLSQSQEIVVEAKVYRLNGQKSEIASSSFTVAPLSSDFDVFEIADILQYEVQIAVSDGQNALVSVWGKDADANLLCAHRFVQNELNIISNVSSSNAINRSAVNRVSNNYHKKRPRKR